MKGKHILVVDEEEKLLNMIDFLLVKNGYHVSTANNGRDAFVKVQLAKEKGNSVDLLITDIDMLEMDDFDLMDEIHKAGLKLKALAISNKIEARNGNDIGAKGFNSFLPKPFGPMQLVEEIKEVFQGKEQKI